MLASQKFSKENWNFAYFVEDKIKKGAAVQDDIIPQWEDKDRARFSSCCNATD